MKGQVVLGKKYLSKAFIRIYADSSSTPVQKLESDIEGYVAFQLPLQKFYTIKISKQGFVTKIITVDAHLPKSKETGNYYFEFALELFENIEGLDASMLKNPIAKVFFNTFIKKFDYDFNYTAKINNDLKKMYHNYDILKKQGKIQTPGTETKTEITKTDIVTPDTTKKDKSSLNSDLAIKKGQEITFSIKVLSSIEQLPRTSAKFKGIVNTKEYQDGNSFIYFVGDYASREEAEKMKVKISSYFPDASIVSFKDGKKIEMNEAEKTPTQ